MERLIEEILSTPDIWSGSRILGRNDFVIRQGEIERSLYFVESGALRVFYVTEYEEITIRFGYKNSFITSLPAFYNNTPSLFYIQAIRKTHLRTIEKNRFMHFISETPERKQQYLRFTESLVSQQIEREIDLLTDSPAERLQRVRERSPQLIREIPLKYIASYLRMTPETLSRIQKS